MSSRLLLAFLVCSLGMSGLSAAQIAQFKPCSFEETSISSTTDGLSVWRVVVQEESAKSTATALIPTAKGPTAGILFTHSKLQGADKGVDLVSFAYGMARAGAASILLDGQMNLNDDNFRSAHLLIGLHSSVLMVTGVEATLLTVCLARPPAGLGLHG